MPALITVVVALVVIALFVFVDIPLIRRGQDARAANGGKHPPAWWAALGAVIVIAGVLLVVEH